MFSRKQQVSRVFNSYWYLMTFPRLAMGTLNFSLTTQLDLNQQDNRAMCSRKLQVFICHLNLN